MTTVLEERIKRLQAASDDIAPQTSEELLEQGKKAAANMLLLYGKSCMEAGGFVHCVQSAHEAALLYLLSEGYVTLTDKGRASDEERTAKENRRNLALNDEPSVGAQVVTRGAYL